MAEQPEQKEAALEGGSYEVIRARLLKQAGELGARVEALNARRRQEFGGQELTVIGNDRVRTEHNCVPRNIVPVGRHLLLGFNVFMGLKQERALSDVFSLHKFEKTGEGAFDFGPVPATEAGGFLVDRRLQKDFDELTRYYKDAKLDRLTRTDARMLAVFRTGQTARDIKVLRFSVDGQGLPTYLDNRGEADLPQAKTHDFEWTRCSREAHVTGKHPHINVLDEIFVETVKGDLTIKVENNTETGQGVYSEPVDDPDQALDDAEFYFAKVGVLILLKVLPFREQKYRYLVFNSRTQSVARLDAIGVSCIGLPEDQGIIFPGGYVLQTGEVKTFEGDVTNLTFKRVVRSPNGEDVLYVFYSPVDGRYVLLPYNLVRKEVLNPIHCHGYALFPDGQMVTFRSASSEPTRVHPMQVWTTPFVSAEVAAAAPKSTSFLGKVGNAELVRGVSDAFTLKRMAEAPSPTRRTFEDLSKACERLTDAYYWLGNAEIGLREVVAELQRASELIVDEFEKVQALQRTAREAIATAATQQDELIKRLTPEDLRSTDAFMDALSSLRKQRGRLITLKDLRFIDAEKLQTLEQQIVAAFENVSLGCVAFLAQDSALTPVVENIDRIGAQAPQVTRNSELQPIAAELEKVGEGLDVLGEVVGGLKVGDPTVRAGILERISDVFGRLNRVRAIIQGRAKDLGSKERRSEFGAQFKLLSLSIESALSLTDTPDKADEQLARLSTQLEELEGRFSEFDEFTGEVGNKREELFEAFGARKQALVDERQRRAANMFTAAERILEGVGRRAKALKDDDALNAYFAGDPMIDKLRALSAQLLELGDSVKSDELDSRLKTARQDALRSMRDQQELFEEGTNVIKLGTHRFNVNTQPLELTVLPKDGALHEHLTGTDFSQRLDAPELLAAKDLWDQTLPSESPDVYRAEFLAAQVLFAAEAGDQGLTLETLREAAREKDALTVVCRKWAADRFDEGYERGLHDADAALILDTVLKLRDAAGLLRFGGTPRAWATLYWAELEDAALRATLHRRAQSLGRLKEKWAAAKEGDQLAAELAAKIQAFADAQNLTATSSDLASAGRYLVEELASATARFVVSADAVSLREGLWQQLEVAGSRASLEADLEALAKQPGEKFRLARAWLAAFVGSQGVAGARWSRSIDEAAALLAVDERKVARAPSAAALEAEVSGLLGLHPRVSANRLTVRLDGFMGRLTAFVTERLPRYQAYRATLRDLLERERKRLKLDELKPKVLSSFVRNRLIDEVYLPLIGSNLAKQLGAAGAAKRTDNMGLLLLISPPGYGKTTLMEYVAARLGLTFVKVNGPALGHEVSSVDPAEAPNATARQEVERINFAFELGNNVMLYLDDIQHTNPELLQKFISLCDAQRKVEGVWGGVTRTYDFRGKKFCVVMAGNPYTESGDRFQIPDMLANRADTYNLGDLVAGKEHLFSLSYLENSLTSNPALAALATRPPKDVHALIRMAQGEDVPQTELSHAYSAVELSEITEVMKRLFRVQNTLLKVNQQYIASASQDDRFRTEPPFKLQGSYRNMNKISEKVAAVMTEDEVERVLDAHYNGESQTLTTAAEVNLLKLAELRGRQSPQQIERWKELKGGYVRVLRMGGAEDDPVVRVTGTLAALGTELASIRDAVAAPEALGPKLDALAEALRGGTLGDKLDELRGAVVTAAKHFPHAADFEPVLKQLLAVRPATPDLSPLLEKLAAHRAPDLSPLLEKLVAAMAERPATTVVPPGLAPKKSREMLPEDVDKQLALLRESLAPLARAARASLQADTEGSLSAVVVWEQVNQALELLKLLGVRASRK